MSFFIIPLLMGLGMGAIRFATSYRSECQRCVESDRQINQLEQAYYSIVDQPVQTSWLDQYFEVIVLLEISVVLLLLMCTLLVLIRFISALEKKVLHARSVSEKSDNA